MASSMFGDRYISIKIHAPKFISSNGTFDSPSNTTEWKIPISDMMTGKIKMNIVRAEIQLQKPVNWILYIGITAAIGLVIALIIALVIKKKESGTTPPDQAA